MSVIFEATIKVDNTNSWFIELKDTVDGRVELCEDLDVFEVKMLELSQDYGGNVDEVKWLKDDNVSPIIIDEIRIKMAQTKAKIEEERGESLTPKDSL
ncbi:hypothetical protein GJV85_09415 [Sulfurimonas aquatica]|uniref:Uncharacterized protein n=1 Tax=Sulfurimonas aquatica TaxID=2672570 RepID=A0A975B150_9BACT|nr:hypothetical protein [Sulfurimonas aquatica]QSZ42316.1 hypothetical protein GJV85_09415 [Sulfurimonas aquatica]